MLIIEIEIKFLHLQNLYRIRIKFCKFINFYNVSWLSCTRSLIVLNFYVVATVVYFKCCCYKYYN